MNDRSHDHDSTSGSDADSARSERGRGRLKIGVALGTGALAVSGLVAAGPLAGALQDDTPTTDSTAAQSTTGPSTSGPAEAAPDPADGGADDTDGRRGPRPGLGAHRVLTDLVSDGTLTDADVAAIGDAMKANRPEPPAGERPTERPTDEEREARQAERKAQRAEHLDTVFASLVSDGDLDQAKADAARAALEDAPVGGRGPGRPGAGQRDGGFLKSLVDDGTLSDEQLVSLRELFVEHRPERPERPSSTDERPTDADRSAARDAREAARGEALETTLSAAVDAGVIDDAEADAIRSKAAEAAADRPDRPGHPGKNDADADPSGD